MDCLNNVTSISEIVRKANIGLWAIEAKEGLPMRLYVDEVMAGLLGVDANAYTPEEMFKFVFSRVDERYMKEIRPLSENLKAGRHVELQYIWNHPDGRPRMVRCEGVRVSTDAGIVRYEGCHQDLADMVLFKSHQSADLLAALVDNFFCVYFVDPKTGEYECFYREHPYDGIVKSSMHNHGNDFFDAIIADIKDFVSEEDIEKAKRVFSQEYLLEIASTGQTQVVEFCCSFEKNDRKVYVREKIARFLDDQGESRIVIGIEDVSQQKKQEEELRHAAEIERKSMIDPMTGCRNRLALTWAYEGQYETHSSIGIVSCDLNGLKRQNDRGGHEAGDRFITNVANLLLSIYGQDSVYRVGGDEFVMVLLSVEQYAFEDLLRRTRLESQEKQLSISLGFAFSHDTRIAFEDLLRIADKEMYEDKKAYYKQAGIDRRSASEMHRNAEFIDAMIDYGSFCWLACRINLTNNTYEVIHTLDDYSVNFRKNCTTLEQFLNYPVSLGIMHPDDVDDYQRYTNLDFLRRSAARDHGKTDHWVKYRCRINKTEYHMIEMQFYSGREYTDENQVGYVLVKDMGAPFSSSRVVFREVLRNLAESFESVFYVDFEQDQVIPYRISAEWSSADRHLMHSLARYSDIMNRFIEETVVLHDKNMMEQVCSVSYLQEQFKIRKAFTQDFRVYKNENEVYYRIKFANMGKLGETKHCVVGFENVNLENVFNREFRKTGEKLLIVDDTTLNREILKDTFGKKYDLFEAENGREALAILEEHLDEIAMVLTDLAMPVCDGFELLTQMKSDRRFCNIPVIVMTAYGEQINRERCLELGASDFISKPYNEAVIFNRVESLIRLRGVTETLNRIEIDSVTGLYTKEAFYNYAQNLLDANPDKEYTIIVSDVVGFKSINEQYNIEMGNQLLHYLARTASDSRCGFLLGGRIGGDIIATISSEVHLSLEEEKTYLEQLVEQSPIPNLVIKFGIYQTASGRNITVQHMCDRARIAIHSIKDVYGKDFVTYDDAMGKQIHMQQLIIKSMDKAIKEKQFRVYYQPKIDAKTQKVAGAEALVRWIHPELGFMNPGVFIPIFEQNGFITKLDNYVWKTVCEDMVEWRGKGMELPISVNVSRRDFANASLTEHIVDLVNYYGIPHDMLHIEITESTYADNPEMIKATIKKLHDEGFIIELDDFGTGYSSLTALAGMDVDVLKFDLSIIQEDNAESEKNVLDFSMNLANMMKLKTVQEGVETPEQYERVKSLGCDYVQGYYFAKPLPKDDFEAYLQ